MDAKSIAEKLEEEKKKNIKINVLRGVISIWLSFLLLRDHNQLSKSNMTSMFLQ